MPGKSPASATPRRKRTIDEAPRAGAERGGAREDAPRHHDAREPKPRADFLEDDVARHLERDIAPEEDARGHAVCRGIEPQILVHGEGGEAHIDAVEIAQEIGDQRQAAGGASRSCASSFARPSCHRFLQNYLREHTDRRAHRQRLRSFPLCSRLRRTAPPWVGIADKPASASERRRQSRKDQRPWPEASTR